MINEFVTSSRIIFGPGSLEKVGGIAGLLGKRAFIITGRNAMKKAGITARLVDYLKKDGIGTEVYNKISGEPDYETVDKAKKACDRSKADIVIGLGGGSVMDTAKAVSVMSGKTGSVAEYMSENIISGGLPSITIPTTAGTGAELTQNSVLTDSEKNKKSSLRGRGLLPYAAVVDPELTLSLPPDITAHSGMDALTQAIESYVSKGAHVLTTPLSYKAIDLLLNGLIAAYDNGSDIEARSQVMRGSMLAGMALTNARLGLVHGLAHPIGSLYGIPHGIICAVLLSHEIRFNLEATYDLYEQTLKKYFEIARIMGIPGNDPSSLPEKIEKLNTCLGIEARLQNLGVIEKDFDWIADESLPSGSLKHNPREVTKEDCIKILKEAF